MKVTAVIPVRAGSRRVPNKNIRPFGENNLLVRKIRQLKKVSGIDEIVVSSDSRDMLEMARSEGVGTQERPVEYCDEQTKTFNEVVEYIATHLEGDVMLWVPCVCPFVGSGRISAALGAYYEQVERGDYDTVVSCREFKEYLFDENGPLNFSIEHHVKSQDLPDWRVIVNGFFVARRKDMARWKFVYGKKPYLVKLTKREAIDIDDEEDFLMAESISNLK